MSQNRVLGSKSEILKFKWNTILNSKTAALRKYINKNFFLFFYLNNNFFYFIILFQRCYEIVMELKKSDKKWTDPEFGPCASDKYGAQSLYLSDNEIPNGCSKPEDIRWLTPDQIIKELIEYGEDQYTKPGFFIHILKK